MSINKNGLDLDLNFDFYSLNEKDLENIIKDKEVKEGKDVISQKNVMIIENNVSSITFLQKPKEISENKDNKEKKENNVIKQNSKNINIQFEEKSFNFPIISRKKNQNNLIINKTSKFDILKKITYIAKKGEQGDEKKQIFEIIKIDNIGFAPSNKGSENSVTKKDETVKEEKKDEKDEKKDKKIFRNLKIFNENKIVLSGQSRDIKMDIQHKINEIEIKGKEMEKGKIEKKYDKLNIVNKVNNLQLISSNSKETKENKPKEMKNKKFDETKIKLEQKEKAFLIHINGEKTISIPKQPLKIQKNANIQFSKKRKESRKYINTKENVINLIIKGVQAKKKNSEILFKKVDNFININDTSQFKNKFKNQNENNVKIKEEKNKNPQLDIYKTKSPNQIKIKKVPSNINTNPNNNDKNNIFTYNNDKLFKEENSNIFKGKNNESLPIINNDVMNLEKQYEKIKKEFKDLYPVFSKNKQYRENWFFQLSQGNIGKYNFYLSLYKIIKDEQEERNSNNFENYLKIKKIINL